ncbi:hypothetical protein CHS0354_014342 [Potamilus streckersoni]|uniref:Ig-like domain-containing protein n=1 Tax=Potamilus streckersoni TaxID=2493646 RepID=A0AAE0SLK8_9BIVA|nr:hypothetical protein CHS0354_014342 [Potamilus streckersoni]
MSIFAVLFKLNKGHQILTGHSCVFVKENRVKFSKMTPGFRICFLTGSLLSVVQGVLFDVVVERPITLPCKVENDGNDQVQWFKKPKTLLSTSLNVMNLYKHRMVVSNPYEREWNLIIERVRMEDTGNYTCKVNGNVMAEIELVVQRQVPPTIHQTYDMTFDEGSTGNVWCNDTGFPTPNITWYSKPPHQVDGIGQDTGVEGNRLILHNITRFYDNIYVCLATNAGRTYRAETRVRVNFGPEVEILEEIVIAAIGEEVTLHCAIAAYPMDGVVEWAFMNSSEPITSSWKYDVAFESELVQYFNTRFVSLKVREGALGNQEYGQYVCRTQNFSRGYDDEVVVIQRN